MAIDAGIVSALLVTAAVLLYVLQPLLTGETAPSDLAEDELTEAEARKRVALLALRDADYDLATGKLDAAEYRTLRGDLAVEALAAIQAEVEEGRGRTPGPDGRDGGVEAEIRRAREALRAGRLCTSCGTTSPEGSRFCGHCGSALGLPEA